MADLLDIIRQTNATFLRQLLQQLPDEILNPYYKHFHVTSLDELVAILYRNDTAFGGDAGDAAGGSGDGTEGEAATAAAVTLMLILPAIIILVGTVGNVLTFLILITDRTMRSVSTYFYLAVLALADTFVLYMGLLTRWVSPLHESTSAMGMYTTSV